MLGYICKYAPIEIFESMGVTMQRIEPDVTNFNQAEDVYKRQGSDRGQEDVL